MKKFTGILIFTQLLIIAIMTTTIAQTTGKYADINGLHMYYEIHGTGKPLVLIHGGGSDIYTSFGASLLLFAKTHKVIAMDLQAHGRTADNGRVTTFEQDADDVAVLLEQLSIKDADVMGFSNGGNTTMQLAVRHPGLVHKIVVASSFYKRSGLIPGFWDGMAQATLANMPQHLQDRYLKIAPRPQDLQIMFERDAKRMQTFKDWNDDVIKSIKVPALVVMGDQDVVTPEHALEMYRLLPHGSIAILPGTHGGYMGEEESGTTNSKAARMFVELVNDFLENP